MRTGGPRPSLSKNGCWILLISKKVIWEKRNAIGFKLKLFSWWKIAGNDNSSTKQCWWCSATVDASVLTWQSIESSCSQRECHKDAGISTCRKSSKNKNSQKTSRINGSRR